MIDFLSSATWQGIGVIISTLISIFGIFLSHKIRQRVFRSKNSMFDKNECSPKELLDGQFVTLYGKVREEVYPGPPNYSSIDDGDKPQFYWILYTNEPISLVGRNMENDELYENGLSCMFQLCIAPEIYDKHLDILGKYVKAEGGIFFGHTGHHKTKALLTVQNIRVLR
ncbi:DUF4431 domain-containing protein [Aeromonas caviae]|uniref:DUF4431 domain-containing protein n=2 Tax=Aeromonas caviae TaxID=648 RepID=UPI00301525CF